MPAADIAPNPPAAKLANTGYKEIFTGPGGFDREVEVNGNETYAPASVSQNGQHRVRILTRL
jgi:hypothetical protein